MAAKTKPRVTVKGGHLAGSKKSCTCKTVTARKGAAAAKKKAVAAKKKAAATKPQKCVC